MTLEGDHPSGEAVKAVQAALFEYRAMFAAVAGECGRAGSPVRRRPIMADIASMLERLKKRAAKS